MDLQNNPFQDAWSAFSNEQDPWRRILVDSIGELQVFGTLAGPSKNEAVLVTSPLLPSYAHSMPTGHGFEVSLHELNGVMSLLIEKRSGADTSLFSAMIFDVFSSLKTQILLSDKVLMVRMMSRIFSWQEFMRNGSKRLTSEQEMGLIGELYCIEDMVSQGAQPEGLIEHWVGPYKGTQDFIFPLGALEVKTTASLEDFDAKISSLEQLDDSSLSPIFLFGYRIRECEEEGVTLNELINDLRVLFNDSEPVLHRFDSCLIAAGYFGEHQNAYVKKFKRVELSIWEVGENFPKLTMHNTPPEIYRAKYSINLNQITLAGTVVSDVIETLGAN